MDLPAIVNTFILISGFTIVVISIYYYSFAFAFWLGLTPIISRVTSFENWEMFPPDRAIKCLLFVVALIKLKSHWGDIKNKSLFLYYVLFICALLLSSALSETPLASMGRSLTFAMPLMMAIMALACLSKSDNGLRQIFLGVIVGLSISTAYALLEFALQNNILANLTIIQQDFDYMSDSRFGIGGRISSFIGQPVYTALYYVCMLPVLLFYYKYYCKLYTSKCFILLNIILGLAIIFLTGTRAAYISIIMLPFIYYIVAKPNGFKFFKLIGIYVAIGIFLLLILPREFLQFTIESFTLEPALGAGYSLLGRLELTWTLWEVFKENFLVGLGPGYIQKTELEFFFPLIGLENQYVVLLAEAGILGFAAFAIFIIKTVKFYLRPIEDETTFVRDWRTMSLSTLIIILIIGASVSFVNTISMEYLLIFLSITIFMQSIRGWRLSRV